MPNLPALMWGCRWSSRCSLQPIELGRFRAAGLRLAWRDRGCGRQRWGLIAPPVEALVGCLECDNNSVRSAPRVVTAGRPRKFSVRGVKFADMRRRVAPSRMQGVVFHSARVWSRRQTTADAVVDWCGLGSWIGDRGRDAHCWAPPAQIRTCAIHASGSYLGCLTSKRSLGQG